jgi:hypothetical protein
LIGKAFSKSESSLFLSFPLSDNSGPHRIQWRPNLFRAGPRKVTNPAAVEKFEIGGVYRLSFDKVG